MDREKVITEIEDALSDNLAKAGHIYRMSLNGLKDKALKDAIALLKEQEGTINELQNAYGYLQKQFFEAQDKLLKEQEAVPVIQREVLNKMFVWCCGSCGVAITDGDKYCRMCGKAVKWD